MNTHIPSRSHKEWRYDNKETLIEKRKIYRQENKEKIKTYQNENKEKIKEQVKTYKNENKEKISEKGKEKIKCEVCGCFINRSGIPIHKKSKKHLDLMLTQII